MVSNENEAARILPLPRENVQRIEEILDAHLTPDEVNLAHDLFKDRSRGIRWGRVVRLVIDESLEDAYMLLHQIPLRKRADIFKTDPRGDFQAVATLPKPKNRHAEHLAVLQMTFKLLTALRANIKQRIEGIPTLNAEEVDLFQDALGEACVIDVVEEGGQVPLLESPPPLPTEEPRPVETVGDRARTAEAVIAELEREKPEAAVEEDCATGKHRRVVILRKLRSEGVTTTKRCKDCGTTIKTTKTPEFWGNPATCFHDKAAWDPEHVGEIARCVACNIEVDIERFDWNGAGLEEPGDSLDTDEVIDLCIES